LVRVKHTAASRRDLIEIWKYVAADNEDAADSLLDSIEEILKLLSHLPC
jgi:plasmid stabilization system protein ParE